MSVSFVEDNIFYSIKMCDMYDKQSLQQAFLSIFAYFRHQWWLEIEFSVGLIK